MPPSIAWEARNRLPTAALALVIAALLLCLHVTPVFGLAVTLTRFGTCLTGPGVDPCSFTIQDGGVGDLNAAPGVITFDEPAVGQFPGGVFAARGTLFEFTAGPPLFPHAILLLLTDFVVEGISGGIGQPPVIPGQLIATSTGVIRSFGVSGGVFIDGAYEGFDDDFIGFADLTASARVGGLLLGQVNLPAAVSVPSPQPFAGSDFRDCPSVVLPVPFGCPVSNRLFGILDFGVAPGDGFVLPASVEFSAAVPEASTLALVGSGLLALIVLRRAGRRAPRRS